MATKLRSRCLLQPKDEKEAQQMLRLQTRDWLGDIGEDIWASILKASGFYYVPLSKIADGGAPMMQTKGDKVILPDFDVSAKGRTAFLEAKAKETSVMHRKTGQERHGIDIRNFDHYLAAQEIAGKKCAIGVVECWRHDGKWSGALLIENLDDLGRPYPGESTQDHMCYWQRKAFRDLDSFTAMDLIGIAKGIPPKVTFDFELSQIFGGRRKQTAFNF